MISRIDFDEQTVSVTYRTLTQQYSWYEFFNVLADRDVILHNPANVDGCARLIDEYEASNDTISTYSTYRSIESSAVTIDDVDPRTRQMRLSDGKRITWYDFWVRTPRDTQQRILDGSGVPIQNLISRLRQTPLDQRPAPVRQLDRTFRQYDDAMRSHNVDAAPLVTRLVDNEYVKATQSQRQRDLYRDRLMYQVEHKNNNNLG